MDDKFVLHEIWDEAKRLNKETHKKNAILINIFYSLILSATYAW
jgi:hypothetical protein